LEGCEEPLAAAGCLIFSFLFSLLEGGLLYYSLARLEGRLGPAAARVDNLRTELLRSCRLLNHLFNIVFVVILADYFGTVTTIGGLGRFLSVVGISVAGVILLGEVLPLAVGRWWPEWTVASLRDFAFAARLFMWPLTRGLTVLGSAALAFLGKKSAGEEVERRVLELAMDGARRGLLAADEAGMIEGVVSLHQRTAAQVMTPRTDIVAVEASSTAEEAIALFRKCGHSRLPVYKDSLDEIVGVLYAKDLLFRIGCEDVAKKKVADFMRRPLFTPETKPVFELLRQMRSERTHIAIVVDEYGGTSGIVTLEDVLEEVVGEIEDEFERAKAERIMKVDKGVYIVDGRATLEEVEERVGVKLKSDGSVETIAGLILLKLGRIPAAGERLKTNGVLMEVLEADPRRVKRVRLRV